MDSDSITVGEALLARNLMNGLPPDGGESAGRFRVYIGSFSFPLPNPPARQRAVFFHDTNHVLTDYDNVFSRGEMDIAAFEIGSGCGGYLFAWFINLCMFALGIFIRPRELFRAFLRGRQSKGSIYCRAESRGVLSAMTIRELRSRLGIDRVPAGCMPGDTWRFLAWACAAVAILLLPLTAASFVIYGLYGSRR